MDVESGFLRRLLARPEDLANRLSYANWLGEQGDPRAPLLRSDADPGRINCAAWLEANGELDAYLSLSPELKLEAEEWRAAAGQREQRRVLATGLDPDWVAFLDSLACSFRPFFFFNGTDPGGCKPDELPFAERIGTRGSVITFESDFREEKAWDAGILRDLGFLKGLELDSCVYGSTWCPVHSFLCELKTDRRQLTGADVLASLRPRAFRNPYIKNVEATSIPFPGDHSGDGEGNYNNQIHNDSNEHYIFNHIE